MIKETVRVLAVLPFFLFGCVENGAGGDDGEDWAWCANDRPLYTPCQAHADCCREQACVPEGPGGACGSACVTDDDCLIPLDYWDWPSCSEGRCVLSCEDDADCPPSMACGGSICVWEYPEEVP